MTGTVFVRAGAIGAVALAAAGCAQQQPRVAQAITPVSHSSAERDCVARAMYFESHRGGDDGMLAVGTVVANRVKSGRYGAGFCDVVAQKGQFAPGVMVRTMDDSGAERARRMADAVLSGKRHPGVRDAMFFHTAGLRFRYPNMHYVLVAGGNAFYEKRSADSAVAAQENARSRAIALAYARVDPTGAAAPIVVASLDRAAARPAVQTVAAPQAVAAAPQIAPATSPAPTDVVGALRSVAPAPQPIARPAETAVAYARPEVPASSAITLAPVREVVAKAPAAAPKAAPEPQLAAAAPKRRVIDPAAASTPVMASAVPAPRAAEPAPTSSGGGSSRFDEAFSSFGYR